MFPGNCLFVTIYVDLVWLFPFIVAATPKGFFFIPNGCLRFNSLPYKEPYPVVQHNGGSWLVDGMDSTERAAKRASISRLQRFSSNSWSSYNSPVPQNPSDSPGASRITQNGKSKGKGKGSGKGKGKAKN
ncbi:hypothetical protein M5689_018448 [Euphorbia peplus]|nr:hypothetical protein M5689_018448 [Euphorbia peplus]